MFNVVADVMNEYRTPFLQAATLVGGVAHLAGLCRGSVPATFGTLAAVSYFYDGASSDQAIFDQIEKVKKSNEEVREKIEGNTATIGEVSTTLSDISTGVAAMLGQGEEVVAQVTQVATSVNEVVEKAQEENEKMRALTEQVTKVAKRASTTNYDLQAAQASNDNIAEHLQKMQELLAKVQVQQTQSALKS